MCLTPSIFRYMQMSNDFSDELRIAVKEVINDEDKECHQYEETVTAITFDESLK